jgi:serine/threonine protein kinase
LHRQVGIAHLDLKLENILIGENFEIKLCDFGFADELRTRHYQDRGTQGYIPPEMINRSSNGVDGQTCDMFALGVVLFTITFGVPPFFNASMQSDRYYKLFYGSKDSLASVASFVKMHPATKTLIPYFNTEGSLSGTSSPTSSDHNSSTARTQYYNELLQLFFSLLNFNPSKRPKSALEVMETFSILQPREDDLTPI